MNEWILILALTVAALASATIGIVCFCCLRTEREMNDIIVHVICEQDCLTRELERARIEKETVERVLLSKLPEYGNPVNTPQQSGEPPE